VLVAVSAHGSASGGIARRVHDLLDDGEHLKGRAGKLVDPPHRHHVAGG
jgi:hypothetical protein